jgi:hypothetical protein
VRGGGVGGVLYKGKGSCGYGILSLTTSSTKSNINSKFVKDLHSISFLQPKVFTE